MYSNISHSCTNSTVVAGYHDSRRNTDTPYRSLWRYICSSCARAGVFPGIPVCPVYRFFLVLPLQAGKSGHRLYVYFVILVPFSLSFLFVFVFSCCSHWSLVDVPLIFFYPADHVPDWQPRILLGMFEARSVNVKKTTTAESFGSHFLNSSFHLIFLNAVETKNCGGTSI